MGYDITIHGDSLEKAEANLIKTLLPAYEETWKRFIGHQGGGKMADMLGGTEEVLKSRKQFAQHHYTVLESLVLMNHLVDSPVFTSPVDSKSDYYDIQNGIMAFHGHIGRVRDNLEKCYSVLGYSHAWVNQQERMAPFWVNRHIVIHGCKVPFQVDDLRLFKIAALSGKTLPGVGYHQDELWETTSDVEYLADSIELNFRDLAKVVNEVLFDLLELVKKYMEINDIQISNYQVTDYQGPDVNGFDGQKMIGFNLTHVSGSSTQNPI